MSHLVVSVRFLDERYHGLTDEGRSPEWPPSPMRLFQALVAGNKPRWGSALAGAFTWLEALPPPLIVAPTVRFGRTILSYVPNNNSDAANQRTAKEIKPTLLNGDRLVEYAWRLELTETDATAHAAVIAGAARHLRALGWGIDLAIGDGRIIDVLPPTARGRMEHHPSTLGGGLLRRVPVAGSLASLERAYGASLRVAATPGVLCNEHVPVAFDAVSYTTGPGRPFCAFRLQNVDEDAVAVPPGQIKQLAGQLRHLAAVVAREAFDQPTVDRVILGHPGTNDRLSVLVLPSVGHPHSDGLIRRVAFAEPAGSDGRLSAFLADRLNSRAMEPAGGRPAPEAVLVKCRRTDSVLARYARESRCWATSTPVLLPGHNEKKRGTRQRQLERACELVGKSLAQAGIHTPAEFAVEQVPYWPHLPRARDYDPRDKLAHCPRYHVRITFERPVGGPLSIGAGRHVGFGVLAAFDE